MTDDSLVVVIVLITLILVAVCACIAENRMKPLHYQEQSIPEFSVPLRFRQSNPAESDNRYDCNAKSLRICLTDDPTTLLGCKELTARCHHFESDTKFHDKGTESIIPRNKTPNEGYAMVISTIADACNPFHGDPVLISSSAESRDYVLGCLCKNPGYIGSENILDSCTTVHICGGKVDDIDKPLVEINCLCDVTESAVRYADGLPSCRPLTVLEANAKFEDWSHIVPWSTDRLIDKRVYNATIRDNLNTSRLLDPCTNSLTDVTREIPGAYYNEQLKTCAYVDYGLPVRTGVLEQNSGEIQTVDGALPSGRHKYFRLIDNVGGRRKIVNVRTEVDFIGGFGTEVNITLPAPLGVGKQAQFWLNTADQMLGGRCVGFWPHYMCRVTEYFDRKVFGVPTAGYRTAPGAFLWATEDWETAELMVSSGVKALESGVALDNTYLDATGGKMSYYGVKFCHKETENCFNGMISFNDENDYTRHHNILT